MYCEFLYPDFMWEHSSVLRARNVADSFTDNSTRPAMTQPEFFDPYLRHIPTEIFRVTDLNLVGTVSIYLN